MGACSCKKKTSAQYDAPLPFTYGTSASTYGAFAQTTSVGKNKAGIRTATKTIQPSAIKSALKKLQTLLKPSEVDEYVDELAQCHSKDGIPFEEYQRIMNQFESGIIPAINDEVGWEPTEESIIPVNKTHGDNTLLNALKHTAGGWTLAEEDGVQIVQHDESLDHAAIDTKEEQDGDKEKEERFCFGEHYADILTSCPEGCALEAVEGLAKISTFKAIPEAQVKVEKSFLKTLRKELRTLKKSLVLTPENSMFVRYDEDRPQFMRAVITGNSDSPYAYGAFLFDIFLPANYPTVPPKITHITPGATSVHANNGPGGFSPNMHQATGKICLSLLGTWAGPGWDANKSNLYQVLSTICFAILSVEHPYYMEPNYGGWEGTAPTSNHRPEVIQYTEEVERGCVQYAILGPLGKPYEYFEEVLAAHFSATRMRIAMTVDKWIGKTINTSHNVTMQDTRDQLLTQLEKATETVSNWDDDASSTLSTRK